MACLARPTEFVRDAAALAAKKLLPIKNGGWLEPGERPLSKARFLSKLRLDDITVHRDGGAAWFDDGFMFFGHVVVVRFGPRGAAVRFVRRIAGRQNNPPTMKPTRCQA